MNAHLQLQNVSVGYGNKAIVHGINSSFLRGKMTCILGPNGSGKTTLLRTLARLLAPLEGLVLLSGQDFRQINSLDLAQRMALVLTERPQLDLVTGREIVSLGRCPYTGFFGRLSAEDKRIVEASLQLCGASHLAEQPFAQMSDGEKQKVLIARALAQQPQVVILDEPTIHLDLRHKVEVLTLLKGLTLSRGLTVVLTLHEPDLAIKACDQLVLVKDAHVLAQGAVEDVVSSAAFANLYGLASAGFNHLTCGIELPAPTGRDIFIVGGGGSATPVYRSCARMAVGFGSGILHQGDLDYYTASSMGAPLISVPAFSHINSDSLDSAWNLARQFRWMLDSGFPVGEGNQANLQLLNLAQRQGLGLLSLREQPLCGARLISSLDELETVLLASRKE